MTKVPETVRYLFNLANVNYVEPTNNMDNSAEYLYACQGDSSGILSEFNLTFTPLAESLCRTFDWFIHNNNYYKFEMNNGVR